MIQAKELRIGNFVGVKLSGFDENPPISVRVNCIDKSTGVLVDGLDLLFEFYELSSIPLTEEWLQRFGGKKNENGTWRFNWGENGVLFVFLHNGYDLYSFQLGAGLSKPVKFVHQFQNFFFAFTENELTIKPKNENKRT